jgi:hypothetical protein
MMSRLLKLSVLLRIFMHARYVLLPVSSRQLLDAFFEKHSMI